MATNKDRFYKAFTKVHQMIFKMTRGRLLGKLRGMPAAIVETTGRRSGQRRETMLTCPIVEPDRVVVIASYYGDSRHPAWFLNLRANPDVVVTMQGSTRRMTAHIANDEEKAAIWPKVVASSPPYAKYQQKTDRDIPVVFLEPT